MRLFSLRQCSCLSNKATVMRVGRAEFPLLPMANPLLLANARYNYFAVRSRRRIHTSRYLSKSAILQDTQNNEEPELLRPDQLCDGTIPYPKALSPSAIMEFKKCPQSFLFQYLYGLRQPTSEALAKGSMCHSALEHLFDLEPQDRTLKVLQDLFRTEWCRHRFTDTYRILFEKSNPDNPQILEWDTPAEREWGKSALKLLENYYELEDPKTLVRPNPLKREIWLNAHLSIDPAQGVTASPPKVQPDTPTFHVRGIVDRLDMVKTADASSKVCLRIVDYKTGKAPNLKYSHQMNEQIVQEAFFQLKIYALLLREKGAGNDVSFRENEMDVRLLRLFYLNSEPGRAVHWDMDMGSTRVEQDALLQEVHQELSNVWMQVVELVSSQDPLAFVGCDRSFCYCHKCRPRFVPGTVWEPPPS
ncbi:helicase [Seminavis robusta]|uniref:Helicase n=1 Tax=Seminavis robusta TaxID=568900 RepID=A0A9N8HHD2_9STRA|nr:helicase [Seminavis robusta]|eukprot:Sro530_g161200.1 helicase (417) ;mRNA; f:29486-30805